MVYQTSDDDITKSFRDLIAEEKQRSEVNHAAGDDDITKSFRDLIAEGKHNSEVNHAAGDDDITKSFRDLIAEDIDIAVFVATAASAASDPAPTAPLDIESQRPPPPRMEDKLFCITCTPCMGVTFSFFLAISCMLLVIATAWFFGRIWGLLAVVGVWTLICCGLCGGRTRV